MIKLFLQTIRRYYCMRDPKKTVSSQLSTLASGLDAFHGRYDRDALSRRVVELLRYLTTLAQGGNRKDDAGNTPPADG